MSHRSRSKIILIMVEQRTIAFGGSEEFGDGLHAEPLAEGVPDVGSTAVAVGLDYLVLLVEGRGGDGEEVAEDFADVSVSGGEG